MRGEFAGINDTAATGLIVTSLRPHCGDGGRVSLAISTDSSRNLTPAALPAIECNVCRCNQSTRRRLTFTCSVGVSQPTYHELTIGGKTEGTAFSHAAGYNDGFSCTFDSVCNNVVDARLSAF
jgi:hypothetical protein